MDPQSKCIIRPLEQTIEDYEGYSHLLSLLSSQYQKMSYQEFLKVYESMEIADRQSIWLGQFPNGPIFGTIKIRWERKFYNHNCWVAHLEDVIISDQYQKRGLGQLLIKWVIESCRTKGCYKIHLACAQNNMKFYEKTGFSIDGQHMIINLK